MGDDRIEYPIWVIFDDGDKWRLNSELEIAPNLEWFDSDDPDEPAVIDARGRPVRVKVVRHEIVRLHLRHGVSLDPHAPTPRWLHRPLFFPTSNDGLEIFIDEASITSEIEAIDVLDGEYGPGWDADGWRIEMIVKPPPPRRPGLLERLLGPSDDGISAADELRWRGRVEVRPLAGPPQRQVLREVILAHLREHGDTPVPAQVESATLAELVDLVRHLAD